MIISARYDLDVKRLRTFIDKTDGIQLYSKNNLYPQIVEAVRDRSFTIQSACGELGNFISGEGFEEASLADLVVNSKGFTMNNILKALRVDAATYKGSFVVHLGVNLLGQYNNISVWPLAFWRLGLPNDQGDVHTIKYNSNWERDPCKELSHAKTIVSYPKFNPETVLEEIEEHGLDYPGQVFYVTPNEDQYSLATFDTVLDQGQTQEEIGLFRLSSIQNGLNATSIFSYPGTFENIEQENKFKEGLQSFIGGKGVGTMVIEDPSESKKAADLITQLTLPNNDKIHEFISKDDKNSILEAFAQPKIITGILQDGAMFNKEEIQDAYIYYNVKTRTYRDDISDAFRKIFANWHQPAPVNFKIKELEYFKAAAIG